MEIHEKLSVGVQEYGHGRYGEAARVASEILQADANNFRAMNLLGMSMYQQGMPDEGARMVAKAVELNAAYAAAHSNLATIYYAQGRLEHALQCLGRYISLSPDSPEAYVAQGNVLSRLGRLPEALANYAKAIELNPNHVEALVNQGSALRASSLLEEALASYELALALDPESENILNDRGIALGDLGRHEDALASYDRALALRPNFPDALYNRGISLSILNRPAEALASYDRALEAKPDYAEALNNRGLVLSHLKRHTEALDSYDRALAAKPGSPETHNNIGNSLRELERLEEALAGYERALALKPDYLAAIYNLGHLQRQLNRNAEAARSYEKLLELAPDFEFAKGEMLHARMLCCDWTDFEAVVSSVKQDLQAGKKSAEPFGYMAISGSQADLRRCAEIFATARIPRPQARLWRGERYDNPRIRVGYLSGEFRESANSYVTTGLFERHDRNRFEIFALDSGWDDASDIRGRINSAFGEIVDIAGLDDAAAAAAIRQRRIDILVDLNGYFGRHRQGVLSQRPCPIQVSYLGCPGTMASDLHDYIIADKHVIPAGDRVHYSESVVYLPDTYWVNDDKRQIAERTPTRVEVDLPETGFVFCCFNNNYKITPGIFAVWMRILQRVEGSVLWLLEDNTDASRNLRREAAQRGVAPERLVFAPRMRVDAHLARQRLADLSLDTLPYNAHTTANDALWAGLAHLTCRGTSFPGRVAASLLDAIGLPDLITENLEEYEARAIHLASTPALLAGIRAKLAANRLTKPLFNTDRFRRHIESAYLTMWERYQRGDPPESFAVQPESP